MHIQNLSGGLAAQVRHYIFVRFAQRRFPGYKWYFDDSYFSMQHMHLDLEVPGIFRTQTLFPYNLERIFGIKIDMLSDFFSADEWSEIIYKFKKGFSMPQILLDNGMSIVMFEGRHGIFEVDFSGKIVKPEGIHVGFHPEYVTLPYDNIYYNADWAKKDWFYAYADENRKELIFPAISEDRNKEYADSINNSFSVGIHVRRGDFSSTGWILPSDLYKSACEKVLEQYPNAHFFIFSNDLDWCKKNAADCGFTQACNTTYVAGNIKGNSYRDMQLLSMCRGIIRNAESSFAQVAGWLNADLVFDIKLLPKDGFPNSPAGK